MNSPIEISLEDISMNACLSLEISTSRLDKINNYAIYNVLDQFSKNEDIDISKVFPNGSPDLIFGIFTTSRLISTELAIKRINHNLNNVFGDFTPLVQSLLNTISQVYLFFSFLFFSFLCLHLSITSPHLILSHLILPYLIFSHLNSTSSCFLYFKVLPTRVNKELEILELQANKAWSQLPPSKTNVPPIIIKNGIPNFFQTLQPGSSWFWADLDDNSTRFEADNEHWDEALRIINVLVPPVVQGYINKLWTDKLGKQVKVTLFLLPIILIFFLIYLTLTCLDQ